MNTEFLNPLRDQWNRLAPRERQLAAAGGIVVGITLLYMLIWLPVQKELARLRVSVPQERTQLQRMREQATFIKPLRARSAAKPAAGTLLSVVEQTLSARNMRGFISRMEASGSNGVQISLDAVPFNSLLSWLADLQDSHSLLVESATVDAHTTPGTVNAKLKLIIENP